MHIHAPSLPLAAHDLLVCIRLNAAIIDAVLNVYINAAIMDAVLFELIVS